MRRVEQVAARIVQHGTPAWHWRENSDAQKTQSGFSQNRTGHGDSCLHQNGLQNIWQQMAHKDASVGSAQRTRRENVLHFLGLQDLSASQARVAGPAGDHEGKDYFAQPRAQERGERDGQKNSRKREESVDQNYIYNAVEPAAKISCKSADREAHDSRAEHHAYTHGHRNARAVDYARKNVAA